MLRLNRSALDQAMHRPPDKRGEEGNIRFVGAKPEEQLALKEWYDNQRLMNIENAGRGRLPLSPYFAKKSYYEAKLIHEVSPDSTIEVVGAYDPRPNQDYPVTVSRRVIGDPEQQREYDAIIDKAYQVFLPIHAQHRHDSSYTAEDARAIQQAKTEADQHVRDRFGSAITDPWQNKTITSSNDAVTEMLKAAQKIDPAGAVAGLLELGIVPGHPEINFIPGSPATHPQAPHGTFVENHIIGNRLEVYLHHKKLIAFTPDEQATAQHQQRLFDRFQLFQQLDTDFYDTFMDLPQPVIDNTAVQQAAFAMLQAKFTYLRYETQTGSNEHFSADFFNIKNTPDPSADSIIARCQTLTRIIQQETVRPFLVHWINHTTPLRNIAEDNKYGKHYQLFKRLRNVLFTTDGSRFFQDTELLTMMQELRENDPDYNEHFIEDLTKIVERLETLGQK